VVQDHLTVPCDDLFDDDGIRALTRFKEQRRLTATNFKANPSIIVIGAGPVGLYAASVLASVGCHVHVIDDGRRGAGWASGGMMGAAYEVIGDVNTPDGVKIFARHSQTLWRQFLTAHNVNYVHGSVFVARTPDEIARLTRLSDIAPNFSTFVEPSELPDGIAGSQAWSCQNDIAFDPRKVLGQIARACVSHNVAVTRGIASHVQAGKVTLSNSLVLTADIIIVATGQSGGALSRDVPELSHLTLVKGQMLAIGGSGVALDRVVRAGRVYLIPRGDLIVVGATSDPNDNDIATLNPDSHRALLDEATLLCPALRKGQIVESWAALRPMTPDGLPLVGQSRHQGILIATGTYRNGWLFAAGIANALMGLVLGEHPAPANLQLFAPNRFPT
jgi:glycine oxidase